MKTAESNDPAPKLYCASALGAFCLGLGDLVSNGNAATVLKIGEVLRQYVFWGNDFGGGIPLLLLGVLGVCLCWVHEPKTRVDAFSRGFSVFAVLAVVTPYQPNPGGLDASVPMQKATLWFSTVHASGPKTGEAPTGTAKIILRPAGGAAVSEATVTVRDAKSAKIIAVERITSKEFAIRKPAGHYVVEVESPGFRRTSSQLQIRNASEAYAMPLEESSLPLSLQRLTPPAQATLRVDTGSGK